MRFAASALLLPLALALPTASDYSSEEASYAVETSPATETPYVWDSEPRGDFTIHKSCNETETSQLKFALNEAKILANHAKEHTLQFGSTSEFFVKYFGNSTTAEVVGIFDRVSNGNNSAYVFRCDDADDKCKDNKDWAGHWREEAHPDETVICELSYTTRTFLNQLCSRGFTVAGSKSASVFAADLLHRFWHTGLSEGVLDHYADTYEDCLELAEDEPAHAIRNTQSLMYYALDVFAYDIAVPGVGCTGEPVHDHEHEADSTDSASASATASEASESTTAGKECHKHSDGTEHCS